MLLCKLSFYFKLVGHPFLIIKKWNAHKYTDVQEKEGAMHYADNKIKWEEDTTQLLTLNVF